MAVTPSLWTIHQYLMHGFEEAVDCNLSGEAVAAAPPGAESEGSRYVVVRPSNVAPSEVAPSEVAPSEAAPQTARS